MKKQIKFRDEKGEIFNIELRLEGGRFSASGESAQCQDRIKPANESQARLVEVWHKWHLNDMNAGTERQMEYLKTKPAGADAWEYLAQFNRVKNELEHHKGIYKTLKGAREDAAREISAIDKWANSAAGVEARKLDEEETGIKGGKYYTEKRAEYQARFDWADARLKDTLVYDFLPDGNLHSYGSAWLVRELPEDFESELEGICEEIEEAEDERKTGAKVEDAEDEARAALVESGVDDEDEQNKIIALAINENLTVGELDDITFERDNVFSYGRQEYKVCTNEEADQEMIEECKNSAWAFTASFLSGFCDIPMEVFEALQPRCEGANDAIGRLIEKSGGWEDFASDAASADGRGHFLNRYDGGEDEQTVAGVDYFIYRN